MRPSLKKYLGWTGAICTVIGVIDLPDQIQRWTKFFASVFGNSVNWDVEILGNTGRWGFTILGICLILIAFDVPQILWAKYGWKHYEQTDPSTASNHPKYIVPKELAYHAEKDTPLQQLNFEGGYDPAKPTLEIEFIEDVVGQRYFTWEMETENGKQVNVQRYSILLKNTSGQDLENVIVKLEKVVEEDPGGTPYLGYELPLDPNSSRIRKRDTAWLRVISYRKQDGPSWISIEGVDRDKASKEGKLFRPHNRRELHLAVRADGGIFLPARFQCWVDDNGCLIMKRLNLDIPNSLN